MAKIGTFLSVLGFVASVWLTAPAAHATPQSDYEACATVPAEAAIPYCTRAIDSGEFEGNELAGIYLNRGLRYDYMGDYDNALDDYDEAIQIDPNFAKAFNNRGGVYFKKKEHDRAIADYDEAIRLDPNYANAFLGRCAVYDAKADYDRAIADCNSAVVPNQQWPSSIAETLIFTRRNLSAPFRTTLRLSSSLPEPGSPCTTVAPLILLPRILIAPSPILGQSCGLMRNLPTVCTVEVWRE
jgi:tetratricopeptide (TPR) repeat protein